MSKNCNDKFQAKDVNRFSVVYSYKSCQENKLRYIKKERLIAEWDKLDDDLTEIRDICSKSSYIVRQAMRMCRDHPDDPNFKIELEDKQKLFMGFKYRHNEALSKFIGIKKEYYKEFGY